MMGRQWFGRVLAGLVLSPVLASAVWAAAPRDKEAVAAFIVEAGEQAGASQVAYERAQWVFENFITYDTQRLVEQANTTDTLINMALARQVPAAMQVPGLSAKTLRELDMIRSAVTLPAPASEELTSELVTISNELKNIYSTGKYCDEAGDCSVLRDMSLRMSSSRDAAELLELWRGWRTVSPPMRKLYSRQVELANTGAQDLGYADLGDYWRSRFDMSSAEFSADMERYWQETKPLYDALQCHVGSKLGEFYGDDVMPDNGMIPAHLLGNMWGQSWGNIEELVMGGRSKAPYDLTKILAEKKMDEVAMVKMAERFFTSLGMDPLPETFYERSLFTRPQDRDVVCHASAWDIDAKDDLRIKMCIQRTGEDVRVVHHELGHNFYQRAYKEQPFYYRGSANVGFHEAVGDAIALSVTPDYLVQVGLLDKLPETSAEAEIAQLMKLALDKVAFLPFALIVDKWRWQVFSGEVTEDNYNAAWWKLREQYQGITSPIGRSEADFDPGAKYHIPANVSYSRYFLAHLLQFQFQRRMCELAEFEGPLYACSAYGSEAAGEALHTMLAAGRSEPWQDTLEAFTGQRDVDPSAMLNYFAPLKTWLDEQNTGRSCGWQVN